MTESTTSSPHDAVFKTFMFTPETARDFLEIHLPEPLRKLCNLQTLRLEPTSFIEKSLRAYYSDVLWTSKLCRKEYGFSANALCHCRHAASPG